MKRIGKFPIEIFCCDFENHTETAQLAYRQQYCRYIKGTCVKPRKSEPSIKVGICSLGSTINKGKEIYPASYARNDSKKNPCLKQSGKNISLIGKT